MSKFETRKIFDCQQMPDDVQSAFFEFNDGGRNDCYVDHCIELNAEGNEKIVTDWLLENGAEISDKSVLVKHWW